jgi:hypothetical protein
MKNFSDRNTAYLFAAQSFMNAKSCAVNGAKVLGLMVFAQVFAGVTVIGTAAGAAAAAFGFPELFLLGLPG